MILCIGLMSWNVLSPFCRRSSAGQAARLRKRMPILEELKRRNVVRVGVAYVVAAWVIIEVSSLILDIYEYPGSVMRLVVALLALGLPFVLFFAWAFEVTPDGIKRDSDVDRSSQQTGQTGRRLNLVTIAF